jgi:exosortase/archaeosortase family protein
LHYQIAGLLSLAVFVWLRDTTWVANASDTLPVLAALPVLFWLGMPWDKRTPEWTRLDWRAAWWATLCFVLGIVSNLNVLFAVAWAQAFLAIANAGVHPNPKRRLKRLLPLAVLAFPWIYLDCQFVGFWFRLSGAQIAEAALDWAGVSVHRLGTVLSVGDVRLGVSEACSGTNSLQTILIGGFALAYIQLGRSRFFWLALPILIGAAWAANTLRVLLTAYIVVWGEVEWATGSSHEWQGLCVLLSCFMICAGLFSCLGERTPSEGRTAEGPH